MTTTDIVDRLIDFRPDPQWAPGEGAELLATVLAEDRNPRRHDPRLTVSRPYRRRRIIAAVGVAATAAAAAVVIPSVLPNGSPGGASPAAATALHRLARVAAAGPTDHVGPGQLRHMIVRERQSGDNGEGPHGVLTTTMESWTDAAGRVWRKDTASDNGKVQPTEYYLFPAGEDDTSAPSPSYLAALPTEPDALLSYLRKHVSGSTSTDEAVFTAVGDMLRGGFAPAKLRSAAIEVLAMTGHVRLGPDRHDALARPAEQFEFVDGKHRPGQLQELYFDPRTAQIIEERDTGADFDFVSLLVEADVVNSVPAPIRSKAQLQN